MTVREPGVIVCIGKRAAEQRHNHHVGHILSGLLTAYDYRVSDIMFVGSYTAGMRVAHVPPEADISSKPHIEPQAMVWGIFIHNHNGVEDVSYPSTLRSPSSPPHPNSRASY